MTTSTNTAYMTGKDILLLPDGATYHLGAKAGQLYPRIITVGDPKRADMMSKLLDEVEFHMVSSRLFTIYSGKYKNVGVSIVAIGMGTPMMDFFVREASFVCPGPMAIIRCGTCGLFQPGIAPGTVVVATEGSCYSYLNFAAFTGGKLDGSELKDDCKYILTKPVKGDEDLNTRLLQCLKDTGVAAVGGLNNSGETFYACQGRKDPHFEDYNNTACLTSLAKCGVTSCEMEAYMLYQLAAQRTIAPLKAAACHVGILNRVDDSITSNITADQLAEVVKKMGIAALECLVATEL